MSSADAGRADPGAALTLNRTSAALVGVWLLAVVSVVSWRPDALFTGGIDPVVVSKAVVAGTALAAATVLYRARRQRGRVGARSLILLLAMVGVSCVGAVAEGAPAPSLVLAVRLAILASTVVILSCLAAPVVVLGTLLVAISLVALVGAVTGAPTLLAEGRLASGLPAMRPNELAGLTGPPLVALAVLIASRGLTPARGLGFAAFFGILLATGSRTTLFVTLLAIALALVIHWPPPRSLGITLLLAAPAVYALVAFTDVVEQVAVRGQDPEQLATLSSRTIAWHAVIDIPMESWHKWIGNGLAAKTIEVDQRWWDSQVLDSSWVSVLSQTGMIGVALLAVWTLATLGDSLRSRSLRGLTLPLLTLLLLRSTAENGLIESSVVFALFLAMSVLLEPGHRYPAEPGSLPPADAASAARALSAVSTRRESDPR